MTFSGQDDETDNEENNDVILEAFVRVKMFQSKIEYRNGHVTVGTDFDPKELIFRNTLSAIGPLSKPVLTYQFDDATLESNISAQITWRDPVGRTISKTNIIIANGTTAVEPIELKVTLAYFKTVLKIHIFMMLRSKIL